MSLVRWEPMRELEEMSNRLNRLFRSDFFARPEIETGAMTSFDWSPVVDVEELSDEYVIKAELPGVPRESLKIDVKDGALTLTGERKQEKEEKTRRYHRMERSYGSFLRTFGLPADVDEQKITADHKDGVLSIHMPKSQAARTRAVEIRVN